MVGFGNEKAPAWRRELVALVRGGVSLRAAARRFHCSVSTAWVWVRRARGRRLDRCDWTDRPDGAAVPVNRTSRRIERSVVRMRRWLSRHDALGYVGALAVRRALLAQGAAAPSLRTIARILQRAGLTPQKRRRHPSPPPGWYLPALACGQAELDQLDVVEGLHLRRAGPIEALTAISLWGKLALATPARRGWRIDSIIPRLTEHWREHGAPAYLQMDNDTRFAGSSRAVRRLGRLVRFCLRAGVVPVFTPPRETGFQAAIESFNALWQAKLWRRFHHRDFRRLLARNEAFIRAHRGLRRPEAPARAACAAAGASHVVFLRRTDARGCIRLLGATACVAAHWPHRLVRATLDVHAHSLSIHALRRRDPARQPLIKTIAFPLL